MESMPHTVSIRIPSTVDGNKVAPAEQVAKWVEAARTLFTTQFGGCEITLAEGSYKSSGHGIITEPVKIVSSFAATGRAWVFGQLLVRDLAQRIAVDLKQESILIELDDRRLFIGQEPLGLEEQALLQSAASNPDGLPRIISRQGDKSRE